MSERRGEVQSPPVIGDRYVNRHTNEHAVVLAVAPAPAFFGDLRVLSSVDPPGPINNGWSVDAWNEHWRLADDA